MIFYTIQRANVGDKRSVSLSDSSSFTRIFLLLTYYKPLSGIALTRQKTD